MIVVDASVALKWVVDEPDSAAAAAIAREPLCAPDIWIIEVSNALCSRMRRGDLSAALAASRQRHLLATPLEIVAGRGLAAAALRLACDLRHPVYDCFYLALAIERDTHVVTADRCFVAAADAHAETKGRVRALGAITPPGA